MEERGIDPFAAEIGFVAVPKQYLAATVGYIAAAMSCFAAEKV
jgi:hypothetical protein